jgi:hypothetical protein
MSPLAYRTLVVTISGHDVPPAQKKGPVLRYWNLQVADSGNEPPYAFTNYEIPGERAWPPDEFMDQCFNFLWSTGRPRFMAILNQVGAEGWQLATYTPPVTGSNESKLWPMGVHTFSREL